MKTGVLFGNYHSYKEWGLRLKKIEIGTPSPKKQLIEIPGGDGFLVLSESLTGNVQYNSRILKFEFDARNCNYFSWAELISDILDSIHGKQMKIILDTDQMYYYDGIVEVSSQKSDEVKAVVVIEAECQPYKMERYGSMEDWEWDPFNFNNGIIREYKNIEVNGSLSITVTGSRKPVIPTFIVESADGEGMTLWHESKEYKLSDGTNHVINLRIKEGTYNFVFLGIGKVSIDYRGGRL